MPDKRDTKKYNLRQGRKIVHTGITKDPERREQEHQAQFPGSKLTTVGRSVTEKSAREWESKQREKSKPTETPKKR